MLEKFSDESLQAFHDLIDSRTSFILTCHENPDGDAIGSTNALAILLNKLGNDVHVIYPETLPDKFNFLQLPPSWEVLPQESVNYKLNCEVDSADVVITLDSSDMNRVKQVVSQLNYNQIVNIDHHPTNRMFGDLNFIDDQASSTCELLFNIIKMFSKSMDYDVAQNLYTGIFTDTGSFRYENVSQSTFAASQELLSYGIKPYEIAREIYEKMPLNLFYFIREVINDLRMTEDGKIAYLMCPRNLMDKYNLDDGDIEGVINYARALETVEFAAVFKETPDHATKVSLRSKTLDVSVVASDLSGGGHVRAAGCLLNETIDDAANLVVERLQNELVAQKS